jgi:hypothetical protein
LISTKKRSDFYIGQTFFYIESVGDRENSFNRQVFSTEIKKLIVTKIGREYIYFEHSRYKIGSDHTEYFWGRGEWRNDTSANKIFSNWVEASDEIDRLDLINRLSDDCNVRNYLGMLSRELLNLIQKELIESI